MPKIYIFHKLLQGILQCYGQIMVPIIFLANLCSLDASPLWRYSHTLHGKINCGKCTMKRSVVQLGDTKREMGVPVYLTLVNVENFSEIPPFVLLMFH